MSNFVLVFQVSTWHRTLLSLKAPDFMTFHNVEFSKQSEQGNSLEANCARKLSRQNQSLLNNEFFYKKTPFFRKIY